MCPKIQSVQNSAYCISNGCAMAEVVPMFEPMPVHEGFVVVEVVVGQVFKVIFICH